MWREQQIDLDVTELLVADDYRDYQVVGAQRRGTHRPLPLARSLEPLFQFFDFMALAHLSRVRRIDDLPFVVDDVDLVDPLVPRFFQIIPQPARLRFRSGGEVFNAHLDRLGDLGGTFLDLLDQVVLAELVQGEEDENSDDQQREHDDH